VPFPPRFESIKEACNWDGTSLRSPSETRQMPRICLQPWNDWKMLCRGRSGQNSLDQIAVDVGQPVVPPLEPIGQPGVVETEEMEQRGV